MSITDKDYIPNPAEQFILDRIREFPTLYPHAHAVISDYIFGTQSDSSWNSEGLIVCDRNTFYNPQTKKMEAYPFVIDESVARSMYLKYQSDFPDIRYDSDSPRNPINHIPDNADESWLEAINMYLYYFNNYDEESIRIVAQAKTFLSWHKLENSYANEPQNTIRELTAFVKRVPTWRAKIKSVQYVKKHGFVEPATFLGIDI